jgi:hypothetical protein
MEEVLLAFGADPDADPVAAADRGWSEDPAVAVVPLEGAAVPTAALEANSAFRPERASPIER